MAALVITCCACDAETILLSDKADNTVRENKNNSVLKFLTTLICKRLVRFGGLLFSKVGHTHGILGR